MFWFLVLLIVPVVEGGETPWGAGEFLIIGASALDLSLTEYTLQRYPAAYEVNPFMQERGVRLAAKAGMTALFVHLHRHYKARGEGRKAWFVAVAVSVVWLAASAITASQLR